MLDLYLLACSAGMGAAVLGFFGTHWTPGEKIDVKPLIAELRYWALLDPASCSKRRSD
jgi:hypothetical protein